MISSQIPNWLAVAIPVVLLAIIVTGRTTTKMRRAGSTALISCLPLLLLPLFPGNSVSLLLLAGVSLSRWWRAEVHVRFGFVPAILLAGTGSAALFLPATTWVLVALTLTAALHLVNTAQRQNYRPLLLILLGIHLLFIALTALTTGWVRVLILCALALTLVLVTTLLDYLFRETDMVYAQSLDKIMANYTTEINGLYASIRGWRHDYHDHLQALKYYLHDDELAAARDYLNQLEDKLEDIDDIVHSGNTVMDAVVNSKLALAEQANIATDVSVFVGHQPLISDIDLVVILGNILDNAIEAASEQPEEADRFIRVYIAIEKQQLYISITNSRRADQIIDINYASTKNDKRGLGIRRINALVAKYHGIINRQYEEGVFVTEVLLPLKQITK